MSGTAQRWQARPMSAPEPLVVAEWWRNRSGQSIRVRLSPWEGRTLIDVRTWVTVDGKLVPGKGFSADIKHLPRLTAALAKVCSRARELHFIPADDENGGDQ